MARKKLEAPAPLTESLGATLPAVIQAEAESRALMEMSMEEGDRQFGDGLPFDEERVYGAIGSRMSLSLQMLVEIGRYLCWARLRLGHGEFGNALKFRLKIGYTEAARLMGLAHGLLNDDGVMRPLAIALSESGRGARTKALEILSFTESQLDALDAGERVNGVDIDDLARMTPSELRAALKAAREQAESDAKIIEQKEGEE